MQTTVNMGVRLLNPTLCQPLRSERASIRLTSNGKLRTTSHKLEEVTSLLKTKFTHQLPNFCTFCRTAIATGLLVVDRTLDTRLADFVLPAEQFRQLPNLIEPGDHQLNALGHEKYSVSTIIFRATQCNFHQTPVDKHSSFPVSNTTSQTTVRLGSAIAPRDRATMSETQQLTFSDVASHNSKKVCPMDKLS